MNFDQSSHIDLSPAPPATPNNTLLVHHQGGSSQAFRWYRKPIKGERTQWVSMARGQCSAQIHDQISSHLQSRVSDLTDSHLLGWADGGHSCRYRGSLNKYNRVSRVLADYTSN